MSIREFQDDRADVLHKYTPDEARTLKAQKEIPETARINETEQNTYLDDEDLVQFENEDIDGVNSSAHLPTIRAFISRVCLDLNSWLGKTFIP